ncbi:hypothetical protein QYF36_015304 [Acer negundo]|nr:hypothetical protein QYF36_015304 [Acer negundo]
MESTPREIDATRLEKGLCEMHEVLAIHELHIWAITSLPCKSLRAIKVEDPSILMLLLLQLLLDEPLLFVLVCWSVGSLACWGLVPLFACFLAGLLALE